MQRFFSGGEWLFIKRHSGFKKKTFILNVTCIIKLETHNFQVISIAMHVSEQSSPVKVQNVQIVLYMSLFEKTFQNKFYDKIFKSFACSIAC